MFDGIITIINTSVIIIAARIDLKIVLCNPFIKTSIEYYLIHIFLQIFTGWSLLYIWCTWWQDKALEYTWQEGCPVEWSRGSTKPYNSCKLLPGNRIITNISKLNIPWQLSSLTIHLLLISFITLSLNICSLLL